MFNIKFLILILFSCITVKSNGQMAIVKELGQIFEPTFYDVRIEPDGRLSRIDGSSILTSEDEGFTWEETETPFELRQTSGTIYVTSYKALSNGNYILYTRHTMHYKENDEWKPLLIEGDSVFNSIPYVLGNKAYLRENEKLYSYDDETKSVQFEFDIGGNHWNDMTVFKNHLLVETDYPKRNIYTSDLTFVATVSEEVYVTEEGFFIKYDDFYSGNGSTGSKMEISFDHGQSYELLYENQTEEFRILGDLNGRLYIRGYISQSEAWSSGHTQARTGHIDLMTGEITQVSDGENSKYIFRKHSVNDHFYHNINGAIIKYVDGDLTDRQVIQGVNETPISIQKMRRASNGTLYAMTATFLYKSIDDGISWNILLDYFSVIDFDLDNQNKLYCISNDRILKSEDEGLSFQELSRQYPEGYIDFPSNIICLDNEKIMVKGVGHVIPYPSIALNCIDCYIYYPTLIFQSENDGLTWNPTYVVHSGYGGEATPEAVYGYPSDFSIEQDGSIETNQHITFLNNNKLCILNKSDLTRKYINLPNEYVPGNTFDYDYEMDYGLSISGDLIRNDAGSVSFSNDCGDSHNAISDTRRGLVFPGAMEESIFIISNLFENEGKLAYTHSYSSPILELPVKLESVTGEEVADNFDKVYTDGQEEYLFSGLKTYKIIEKILTNNLVETLSSSIIIYPNPVSEMVHIDLKTLSNESLNLSIYNYLDQQVYSETLVSPLVSYNMLEFSPGIYFVRIKGENFDFSKKLIKL